MEMDHDDIDEDIERLNVILQDDQEGEGDESDGELRGLENQDEEYYSNPSRPTTSSDVTASSFPTTSVCTDADESLFRFDPSTITAETCLAMNRAYQEVLLDTLRQIEISLIDNRNNQKALEERVDEKSRKIDRPTNKEQVSRESRVYPYFKDKGCKVPPFNADVHLKEQMNEDKQHLKPKFGWSKDQRKKLIDAIKVDSLEQVIRPLLNKQEVAMGKLSKCKNDEEIKDVKERVEKLRQDIKEAQELPADELLRRAEGINVDFLKISSFTFDNFFTPMECESMWKNVMRPSINRSKWTPEEEEQLAKLAMENGKRNWARIAEQLGTNRTPFQCLQHYQQNNIVYETGPWTEEEDEMLRVVVETCTGVTGIIHWHQVAYYIDRRSQVQCKCRWNQIDPNRKHGRWTREEDEQLLNAIQLFGEVIDWVKVQEYVPTRDAKQCRERFLHMGSIYRPWTYDEDKLLLTLHKEIGDHWTEIAKHFYRRNDNMVLIRYKRLMKWQGLMDGFYNQPRKIQQRLLHPSFKLDKHGTAVPKSGLKLRYGAFGRPKVLPHARPETVKTELKTLRETGGKETAEIHKELFNVKEEQVDEAKEEAPPRSKTKKRLQDSLDVFVSMYNVVAEDYYSQLQDKITGDLVVPRPPPMNGKSMEKIPLVWKRQNKLTEVVVAQIDNYLSKLQENNEDPTSATSSGDLDLYKQISEHIKIEDEAEKRKMILLAFGGKNPSHVSVRELLNISKCLKENGKPPKCPRKYNKEPWEVEWSDDEDEEVSATSSEDEDMDDEPSEPVQKKPRTEKQIAHHNLIGTHLRKLAQIENQLQGLILAKMDPREYRRNRGRKTVYSMYPKKILLKYRNMQESKRLNRKSMVLLMKTLDVNGKKAYFKARRGKRKLSALSLLKSTEKSTLWKVRTRQEKSKIQEEAQLEAKMTSETSEVADSMIELKEELQVKDSEEDLLIKEGPEDGDSEMVALGYGKSLPYIPPNQTNLRGFRSLLLEHRILIDQAGSYFNADELKQKLYELKQAGPNPLMGVLNAIGKSESVSKSKVKNENMSPFPASVCRKQMKDIRQTTAYQQLKARFQSVFTWPALMSTIAPPKGKPLPKALQDLMFKVNPAATTVTNDDEEPVAMMDYFDEDAADADSVPNQTASQTKIPAVDRTSGMYKAVEDGSSVIKNRKDDTHNAVDDVDTGADDGLAENAGAPAQDEGLEDAEVGDLNEEQAVEKLVDKIMAEYEKERSKKKRKLPVKKKRNFSVKQKQAFVEKERTKILKKIGLYEKMQEFKQRRLETEQSVAMAVASPSNNTDTTATSATEKLTDPMEVGSTTDLGESTSGVDLTKQNNTALSVDSSKQNDTTLRTAGCCADLISDDVEMTEEVVKTDTESAQTKKRGRGRPQGSKNRSFCGTTPVRKSSRTAESPASDIKQEEGFEFPKPKKKSPRNKVGEQYSFVRNLIPGKMEKIAAQIPDLPILKEPVKVKTPKPVKVKKEKAAPKPRKKKKIEIPIEERKRVGSCRARKVEIERRMEEKMMDDDEEFGLAIKVEQFESEDESGENLHGDESIDRTDRPTKKMKVTLKSPKKIKTARVKRAEVGKETSEERTVKVVMTTPEKSNKGHMASKHKTTPSETLSTSVDNEPAETGKTVESFGNNEQDKPQPDNTNRQPMMVAVPVMVGGVQQVAMIPFYPDDEGKITLPSGKKIDAKVSQQESHTSLPVVGLNHPVQLVSPSPQAPVIVIDTRKQSNSSEPGNEVKKELTETK